MVKKRLESDGGSIIFFVVDLLCIILFTGGIFKIFNTFTDTGADFGQFAGTENNHYNNQNYDKFRHSKSEHNDTFR